MLLYFTGNSMFETELKQFNGFEGSLNKGLMLMGGIGTGKSLLFKIFRMYTGEYLRQNSFREYTAIDIIDNVNVEGIKYLEKFSHNLEAGKPYPIRCYIDDIAAKNERVKHFGTDANVIEQLLSIRYNLFQAYGTLTHISTNKYPKELAEMYDSRILDRMKQMFNIIELNGESFRK